MRKATLTVRSYYLSYITHDGPMYEATAKSSPAGTFITEARSFIEDVAINEAIDAAAALGYEAIEV